MMNNLNFVFVGPQRTGTTWMYNHLINHPTLSFPKGVKETMFFDQNYEKRIDWYYWHFSEGNSGQKCGEVAPTYFDVKEVPERIRDHFPDCKIIISLRDPVEKAQSLYQHHYQKGRVRGSFSEAVKKRPDILTSGYYKDHLERWYNCFKKEQILVVSTNQIKNEPVQLLNTLCDFLEVDRKLLSVNVKGEKVNTAQRPRFHILAKIGSSLVTKLHSLRLHRLVNLAKELGLKKLFFEKSDKKPVLTSEEREYLKKEYSSHIEYVNEKFENIAL